MTTKPFYGLSLWFLILIRTVNKTNHEILVDDDTLDYLRFLPVRAQNYLPKKHGKLYDKILPVLLEIEGSLGQAEELKIIKQTPMQWELKLVPSNYFCETRSLSDDRFGFAIRSAVDEKIEVFDYFFSKHSGGEFIYYYDLRFDDLVWNKDFPYTYNDDTDMNYYYKMDFRFVLPVSVKTNEEAANIWGKASIEEIKQPIPESTANKLVLI